MSQQHGPAALYREEVERGVLEPDPAQARLVEELQVVFAALVERDPARWWGRILRALGAGSREPAKGLYVWGGVGRGKTHLMNLFHESLPFDRKLRIHFHGFMQMVHAELKGLARTQDPLSVVADRIAERARVVSFDEFHVSDITDAMLLGRLFGALFERGVTLVATSNTVPAKLYEGGLQRERFLSAIALIERHTRVFELHTPTDYRLRTLEQAEIYHHPLDAQAERGLEAAFAALCPLSGDEGKAIDVLGRSIATVRHGEGVAWFTFAALCEGARSSADYIEVAREFHTVLLSAVPLMDDRHQDPLRRFIHLVDELYDRNVNLIVSAAGPPQALYQGNRLAAPYQRTESRLIEMQSKAYLSREHLP